jgi:hypothetical protein
MPAASHDALGERAWAADAANEHAASTLANRVLGSICTMALP